MKILLSILSILIVSACGTEANIDDKRTSESSEKTSQDSFELEMDDNRSGAGDYDFDLGWDGLSSIGIDFPDGMPDTAQVKIACNTKTDGGWKTGGYETTVYNKTGGDTASIRHTSGHKAVESISRCQAFIYQQGTLKFYKNAHTLTRFGNLLKGWAKR